MTTEIYPSGIIPASITRFCPHCDAEMAERVCAADGTATLLLESLSSDLAVLKPGYVLNHRYRLEKELGRGGFGAVYAAKHTGTGQTMAVKVLFSAGDRRSLKRFFREARVTAQLKSKHTIKVFDFGQDDNGMAYLAMELLQGQPLNEVLNDRLRDGRTFSEKETIDVAVAVCKSLNEAHAAGLIHRDLKPHNIFCAEDEDGLVYKVLDFGIAKSVDQSLTGGSILGTVAYMSPEQAQNDKLDGRSDLYSLGVMLFQLVAGEVPFAGETPIQTLMMHINGTVPPLRLRAQVQLTDRFVDAVERLLSKSPDGRMASAADTIAELDPLRAIASDTARFKPMTVIPTGADLHAFSSSQDDTMGDIGSGTAPYRRSTGAQAPPLKAITSPTVLDATAGVPKASLAEAAGEANLLTPLTNRGEVLAPAGTPLKWVGVAAVAAAAVVIAVLVATHHASQPGSQPATQLALPPASTPVVAAPAPPAPAAPAPVLVPALAALPAPVPAAAADVPHPSATATGAAAVAEPTAVPAAANDAKSAAAKPTIVHKKKADGKAKSGAKSSLEREL